jgi:hypothetical protein
VFQHDGFDDSLYFESCRLDLDCNNGIFWLYELRFGSTSKGLQ